MDIMQTFDIEAEAGIQGKGRRYGRGVRLRLACPPVRHWSALKWIGRPVIGSIVFFVRGKFKHVELLSKRRHWAFRGMERPAHRIAWRTVG